MSEHTFEKDQKEYLIFRCKKCDQYSYVKKTQKTKKCLRCNRTYQVRKIEPELIVKGMSKAVETVKRKQSELAIIELQQPPKFRAKSDFRPELMKVPGKVESGKNRENRGDLNYLKFINSLKKISQNHKEIPLYMLKISCKRENIPISELKFILKKTIKEGIIKKNENGYFRINP